MKLLKNQTVQYGTVKKRDIDGAIALLRWAHAELSNMLTPEYGEASMNLTDPAMRERYARIDRDLQDYAYFKARSIQMLETAWEHQEKKTK